MGSAKRLPDKSRSEQGLRRLLKKIWSKVEIRSDCSWRNGNSVSVLPLLVSAIAVYISGLTYYYQYWDHIKTSFSVTRLEVFYGRINDSSPVQNVEGRIFVTIFNPGNRPVSVDDVELYLERGDYAALVDRNPLPPCNEPSGSKVLFGRATNDLRLSFTAKVIEAQHILTIPIYFQPFGYEDAALEQGLLCLMIRAYEYDGVGSEVSRPVGIIKVMQGPAPPAYRPLYKQAPGADKPQPLF